MIGIFISDTLYWYARSERFNKCAVCGFCEWFFFSYFFWILFIVMHEHKEQNKLRKQRKKKKKKKRNSVKRNNWQQTQHSKLKWRTYETERKERRQNTSNWIITMSTERQLFENTSLFFLSSFLSFYLMTSMWTFERL